MTTFNPPPAGAGNLTLDELIQRFEQDYEPAKKPKPLAGWKPDKLKVIRIKKQPGPPRVISANELISSDDLTSHMSGWTV